MSDQNDVLSQLHAASTQGEWSVLYDEQAARETGLGYSVEGPISRNFDDTDFIGVADATWIAESHNRWAKIRDELRERPTLGEYEAAMDRVRLLEAQKADPALNSLAEYAQETQEQRKRADEAEAEVARLRALLPAYDDEQSPGRVEEPVAEVILDGERELRAALVIAANRVDQYLNNAVFKASIDTLVRLFIPAARGIAEQAGQDKKRLDQALAESRKSPWSDTATIESKTFPVGEHFQPGSTVTIYGEGEQ